MDIIFIENFQLQSTLINFQVLPSGVDPDKQQSYCVASIAFFYKTFFSQMFFCSSESEHIFFDQHTFCLDQFPVQGTVCKKLVSLKLWFVLSPPDGTFTTGAFSLALSGSFGY